MATTKTSRSSRSTRGRPGASRPSRSWRAARGASSPATATYGDPLSTGGDQRLPAARPPDRRDQRRPPEHPARARARHPAGLRGAGLGRLGRARRDRADGRLHGPRRFLRLGARRRRHGGNRDDPPGRRGDHPGLHRTRRSGRQAARRRPDGDLPRARARRSRRCSRPTTRSPAIEVHGERPRMRAGAHHGRPRRVGRDFLGVDVNIAARVAQAAKADELLVSGAVREGSTTTRFKVEAQAPLPGEGRPEGPRGLLGQPALEKREREPSRSPTPRSEPGSLQAASTTRCSRPPAGTRRRRPRASPCRRRPER